MLHHAPSIRLDRNGSNDDPRRLDGLAVVARVSSGDPTPSRY